MKELWTEELLAKINAELGDDDVLVMDGKYGDAAIRYLSTDWVIDKMNEIFDQGRWYDRTIGEIKRTYDKVGENILVTVEAQVELVIFGEAMFSDVGVMTFHYHPLHTPIGDVGDMMEKSLKGARSVGLKRCVRSLGRQFGNGLYASEAKHESGRPGAVQPDPNAPTCPVHGQGSHIRVSQYEDGDWYCSRRVDTGFCSMTVYIPAEMQGYADAQGYADTPVAAAPVAVAPVDDVPLNAAHVEEAPVYDPVYDPIEDGDEDAGGHDVGLRAEDLMCVSHGAGSHIKPSSLNAGEFYCVKRRPDSGFCNAGLVTIDVDGNAPPHEGYGADTPDDGAPDDGVLDDSVERAVRAVENGDDAPECPVHGAGRHVRKSSRSSGPEFYCTRRTDGGFCPHAPLRPSEASGLHGDYIPAVNTG